MKLWESLGLDTQQAALKARKGDENAIVFLIGAYRPLVAAVVAEWRKALQAHRGRPDFEQVVDVLAQKCLPVIIEKWDPGRGSFGAYAKNWGRYVVRDELATWLCATDRAFSFDRRTKKLAWPRCSEVLGECALPEDYEEWALEHPVTVADLFRSSQRSASDRLALVAVNELANAELSPSGIAAALGRDQPILELAAEEELSDVEIAARLGLHRTTVTRRKRAAMARLAAQAKRAMDRRVGRVDPTGDPTEQETLEWLSSMALYRQGRARRSTELEPEIPSRSRHAARCTG